MKILVADDQPLVLQSIIYRLQKSGYDVQGVVDGQQAKEFFVEQKPDLVITDILMPFVTGPELIHFIRTEERSNVPIIVLSTLSFEEEKVNCFDLGVDDYVTKPFLPGELVARVKRFHSINRN